MIKRIASGMRPRSRARLRFGTLFPQVPGVLAERLRLFVILAVLFWTIVLFDSWFMVALFVESDPFPELTAVISPTSLIVNSVPADPAKLAPSGAPKILPIH